VEAVYGRRYDPVSEITVTAGATQAILTAILAVVHPGDEVIVLEPCYDSYVPNIELAGGVAVRVPLTPGTFRPDFDRIAAAMSAKTSAIVINSPHNPSATVWSDADMRKLQELLAPTDVLLISDEVYEHIIFDGRQHESVLRYPELAERSFVISSFGKTYHCTGWKIGYCIAPPALTKEFRKVHQYNTFCTFAPAQWAFAEMIQQEPEQYEQLGEFYQSKRDAFKTQLLGTRFQPLAVPGGYFQLVDYSEISDLSDLEFCRWLTIEKGVTAIPLSPFYEKPPEGQRLVRLCFAKNSETLDAAIERLVKV